MRSLLKQFVSTAAGVCLLLAWLVLTTLTAYASAPVHNTQIANIASLNFTYSNATNKLPSNAVVVQVNNLPNIITSIDVDQSQLAQKQLTYTLTIANIGTATANGNNTIKVDGFTRSVILFDDAIPANVSLVSITTAGYGVVVYHLINAGVGEYTTKKPADLSLVDRVGLIFDSMASAQNQQLKFVVNIHDNAVGTTINNEASLWDKNVSVAITAPVVTVSGTLKTILQSKDQGFQSVVGFINVNGTLYLEASCALCNIRYGVVDHLQIRITSQETGDEELVTAVETGENTGIFRVKDIKTQESKVAIKNNLILETLRHDTLHAVLVQCLNDDGSAGQVVNASADILVDPYGIVFDTKTNKPLSGFKVMLFDAVTKQQPEVRDDNNQVIAGGATITSDSQGRYRYPLVAPGQYYLVVVAGESYNFPTTLTASQIDSKWTIVDGSFGKPFYVSPSAGPVEIDLPLDPTYVKTALFLKKSVAKSSVEIGDFLDYTLVVKNPTTLLAKDVVIADQLPMGFTYVANTARIAQKAQEPQFSANKLQFTIGDMSAGTEVTINYRVRVGVLATKGDAINRAVAYEQGVENAVSSNQAVAKVQLIPSVFSQDGFITGKVYTDCNRDGVQGIEEVGVPGIRLYLEDGSFVVTDIEGKYDFYGVSPRTHVLKLDRTTLPKDVELIEQSVRNAGDPNSRFVDLRAGELQRADFAITTGTATCSGPAMDEIYTRRAQGDKVQGEVERLLKAPLVLDPVVISDVRALPANGCVDPSNTQCGTRGKANLPQLPVPVSTVKSNPVLQKVLPLESYLTEANNTLAVLNLTDGQVLPYTQVTVQIKGVAGALINVRVNGELASDKRISKQLLVADRRIEAREYIGLPLKAGENTLDVEQVDGMGNVRGHIQLKLIAPDSLAVIKMTNTSKDVEANGENQVPLTIELQDKAGVPVMSRTQITLEASAGRFVEKDLDPKTPGTQLFIEGGKATVNLLAPTEASVAKIVLTSGNLREETKVNFVPELRPLLANGIVEGMVSFSRFDHDKIQNVSLQDGFEQELRVLASADNGQLKATGRSAVFLKGKVKGSYLLTLAYDSDKHSNERLFRDIRPDDYYPVYGDSAAKGFDAQSTSKLYVRVDKGSSYVVYGDYNTRVTEGAQALQLGQYNRSLTGVRSHYENKNSNVTAFVAQTNSKQMTFEIPAQGISGPYTLTGINGLLVNSEKVEILVRDRNNTGVILSAKTQARFTDYEFEPLTASIYFRQAIPSVDAQLNPYSIRVTVEVNSDGQSYWVTGVAGEQKITSALSVGGSVVKENLVADNYQLASVNSTLKLNKTTRLLAEVAQTDRDSKGTGQAARVEISHESGSMNWRVFHGQSDVAFDNTAAPLNAGRTESGAKLQMPVAMINSTMRAEATRSEDGATGSLNQGATATLEHRLNKALRMEVGARYYEQSTTATSSSVVPTDGVTMRGALNIQPPSLSRWTGSLEYEQDVTNSDRQRLTAGTDYRFNDKGRVYARHELVSSLTNVNGLNGQQQRNTSVIGVDDEYMKDGRVFSEYRVRDSINAVDTQTAIGLRNRWSLTDTMTANTNIERTTTLKGNGSSDATALSVGLEYLASQRWKATTKIDLRWADSADTLLHNLGLAWKLDRDWTLLMRNLLNVTDNHTTGNKIVNRWQLGAAYRQVDQNRWDALGKLECKYENDQSQATNPLRRDAYIISGNINYHPERRWTLTGNHATKLVYDRSTAPSVSSRSHLLGMRLSHDITERWEASVQGGYLWGDTGASRYVMGVEAGYLAVANLWLSVGYNFQGYHDYDLVGSDYTVQGVYMRFRFKFDEDLFRRDQPAVNRSLEPAENVSP